MDEQMEHDNTGTRQDQFDSLSIDGDEEYVPAQSPSVTAAYNVVGEEHTMVRTRSAHTPVQSTFGEHMVFGNTDPTPSHFHQEPINVAQLLDRCEGDVELLAEVLSLAWSSFSAVNIVCVELLRRIFIRHSYMPSPASCTLDPPTAANQHNRNPSHHSRHGLFKTGPEINSA